MAAQFDGAKLWIAVTDKIGHINQCIALTDALACAPDRVERIAGFNLRDDAFAKLRRRARGFVQTLRLSLQSVPDRLVLVVSGRSSGLSAMLLRWRMGKRLFVISVGVPIHHLNAIDLAVISEAELPKWQERRRATRSNADEVVIIGALARRFPSGPPHDAGRPLVAVLIGGENKDFSMTGVRFQAAVARLRELADRGEEAFEIVLSRRTSSATEALIREVFSGSGATIHERENSRAYRELLGKADRFVVTPDSVTMLSEVCLAGKPVFALDLETLPESDGDGQRLVEAMTARGAVRVFDGTTIGFTPEVRLDEAARIAPIIEARIAEWCAV